MKLRGQQNVPQCWKTHGEILFDWNKNDLNLRILSWFYSSALFTTDRALSHLQPRSEGFRSERGGCLRIGRRHLGSYARNSKPFESVLCLNQSALIKCILCHIFTRMLVAVCIKGITSANKRSFIIC